MARHQPEMKKLQAKYKDDKDRLNQEMMKFYRENKINPLASCLPLLAQIPVFISLFYMLRKDLRLDICPTLANGAMNPIANPKAVPRRRQRGVPLHRNLTHKATGGVLVDADRALRRLAAGLHGDVHGQRRQDAEVSCTALPFFFVVRSSSSSRRACSSTGSRRTSGRSCSS